MVNNNQLYEKLKLAKFLLSQPYTIETEILVMQVGEEVKKAKNNKIMITGRETRLGAGKLVFDFTQIIDIPDLSFALSDESNILDLKIFKEL